MDRGFDFYDEGLNLVNAMRVAAGEVPHRDFYANYGPGQFYMLSGLFKLFGSSIFVDRIYDLFLRSAIVTVTYGLTTRYCRRSLAAATTVVCWFWLFSVGLPTYPIIPVLLLVLAGSALLIPTDRSHRWNVLLAGGITGLAMLFRYEVGLALALVHLALMLTRSRRPAATAMRIYCLGAAAIFLPAALLYLSVAPVHPFIHDIILYPAKYYARARRLPFPGIRWRSLENLAVYLPVVVALLCVYTVLTDSNRAGKSAVLPAEKHRREFLILFGLLAGVFFWKGLVRISIGQMLLSIIPAILALAVLMEVTSRPRLHRVAWCAFTFSAFTATWSALKEVRLLALSHQSVLQEFLAGERNDGTQCQGPRRLQTGLCFVVDPQHLQAIAYLSQHTQPSERIFIGLSRHDRLVMNDLLTYFLVDRLPATRWAHFDPDLQTRADVQSEMIQELDAQRVRYIVLESQFDSQVQPWNDSSKSSGVTLLDDYIRRDYHLVETYGPISIWLRNVILSGASTGRKNPTQAGLHGAPSYLHIRGCPIQALAGVGFFPDGRAVAQHDGFVWF